jgi:HTH-type transcriptional regulator, sugar sensing transcriptional regulator
MDIKETLNQIGIEGKKADVYLACLEIGGATAYLIAKKTGLKRPTVYDIVNQLIKEGLVHKALRGNIKHYSPADPEVLWHRAREKERKIRFIMDDLQNLYNAPKTKPFIRYFEGEEGIKEMYEDSLRSCKKGDEILAYVGEDVYRDMPEYLEDYIQRRVEKNIRIRGIYKKSLLAGKFMEKNREQLREVKILSEQEMPFSNETDIYKNKIAIASYGVEMFGMIIESEEIARSQKAIFELLWKNLK